MAITSKSVPSRTRNLGCRFSSIFVVARSVGRGIGCTPYELSPPRGSEHRTLSQPGNIKPNDGAAIWLTDGRVRYCLLATQQPR